MAASASQSPLSVADIPHLEDEPEAFEIMKTAINETIAEYAFSFDEDVRKVLPCTDWVNLLSQDNAVDNCNIRISLTAKGCSVEQLRDALEATLARHPLLLSFFLHNDPRLGVSSNLGLYVVIKHCRRMLNFIIHNYGVFDRLEDARKLPLHPPIREHSRLPGPLFNALVCYVKETEEAAVFLNISHAISDAAHANLFIADLDLALRGIERQAIRPSYQLYADSYYSLRHSPAAKAAVNDTIKRLRTIQAAPRHTFQRQSPSPRRSSSPDIDALLWPKPRMDFETFTDIPDIPTYNFNAPQLVELIKKHPRLTAKTLMKAATALLAMSENGSEERAVFFGIEENRKHWPFIPSSMHATSPAFSSASDVPGPTWNGVINNMQLNKDQSVLDFLYSVQDEQDTLEKYSSVPCYEVFRQLKGHATEKLYQRTLRSLVFNWVPLLGDLASSASESSSPIPQALRLQNVIIPSFVGCLITCALSGPKGDQLVVSFQGAEPNIDPRWTVPVFNKLKAVSLWLINEAVKADANGMAKMERFTECMV
ncbi:hypothetical protein KEM55_006511 [Ascosphaera atra]|nr:hypothetical protein KEM55_006511 [Ascosphaera atra]